MNTNTFAQIDLRMLLKGQVYYPPVQHTIMFHAVVKVPASARLITANDNEDKSD
jgi:hypothetical protein